MLHLALPLPEISYQSQAFIRITYGVLQCINLMLYLPHARRFFLSERWGGYAQSSPPVDWVQNPWVMPGVMLLWLGSSVGIVLDYFLLPALALNLIFCWYYFVWGRWKGVLRGSGAPGLMNYWLAAAVFTTELAARGAPSVYSLAVYVFQVELAIILFTSGFYKCKAGFLKNEGMDYGLVNPQWGYAWRWYRKLSPRNWIFKLYNQCAWTSQILCAVLMLVPGLRWLGGLLLIVSFLLIQVNIRLALLSAMMMLCGVLFFEVHTPAETLLAPLLAHVPAGSAPVQLSVSEGVFPAVFKGALLFYLAMLPVVYGGLFINFYTQKALPGFLQRGLDRYAGLFGMILWRVFTMDLIDFTIRIYKAEASNTDNRILLSRWEDWTCQRFRHVAESIAVTSLFTTLKYYPSRPRLFEERLLRYGRTLPCSPTEVLIFEYVKIVKEGESYTYKSMQEFLVNPSKGQVQTLRKDPHFSVSALPSVSPIKEASGPGTYKPHAG